MRKKTLLILIPSILIIAALVTAALLPGILSSGWAKSLIISQLNRSLPGQIDIADWQLHWTKGIQAAGLTYDHHQAGFNAKVARLSTDKGLLHFIRSTEHLGSIEIKDPKIFLSTDIASQSKKESKDSQDEPSPAAIPVVFGQIKISNGSVIAVKQDKTQDVIVKDLHFVMDAAGPTSPVSYRFFLTSGDNIGKISGQGELQLADLTSMDLSSIRTNSALNIEQWEVKDILSVAAARMPIPNGRGRLNGDLTFEGRSEKELLVKGHLSSKHLTLWGGAFNKDKPQIKNIAIDLNAAQEASGLLLDQLSLKSSFGTVSAKGFFKKKGDNSIALKAELRLAELAKQLPDTLKLRKSTKITKGNLAVDAKLTSGYELLEFDSQARIDRLAGISNGKPLQWNQPVTINTRGEMRPEGFWLENLNLKSPFMTADGQGDLKNLRLNLSADVGKALSELKKFVRIKEWNGNGQLNAQLQLQEQSTQLSKASIDVQVGHFELTHSGRKLFPKHNFNATLQTDLLRGKTWADIRLQKPRVQIDSAIAKGSLTASDMDWTSPDGLPNIQNLTFKGQSNLASLTSVLQAFGALDSKTRLAGSAALQTKGMLQANELVLNPAQITTSGFVLRQGSRSIKDNKLSLKTNGRINLKTRSLKLASLEINGEPGKIVIPELIISDWSQFDRDLKTQAVANVNLTNFAKSYGAFFQLPPQTKVAGQGKVDLDIDFSNPKAQAFKLRGDLAPLELSSPTLPPIREKRATLDIDIKRSPDGKSLSMEKIALNSSPLSLAADGTLDQTSSRKVLDAKGNLGLDFKLVSAYLQSIMGPRIKIAGKSKKPFTLKMTSPGNRWADPLKHTSFSGAFDITAITLFGLEISPLQIPIQINNAAADANLKGKANGGDLRLQPMIDLKKEPFVLSIPKNTQILTNVQITDLMAEQLLGGLNPIFFGAKGAEGSVDLFMQYFTWPLSKEGRNQAAFAGTLSLKGVRLSASPFLSGVLSIMNVGGNQLDFDDIDIDFVARNGRVTSSPIQLNIGGFPLKLAGSLGLDGSVDYNAQIPVAPLFGGKDIAQLFQGVTVNVPIRGTSSKPKVDSRAAKQKSNELEKQALEKQVQQGVINIIDQFLKKSKK